MPVSNKEDPGVGKSQQWDIKTAKKLAAQGDAEAQFRLAIFYGVGNGVPKDKKVSLYWAGKAASQGYSRAQVIIGLNSFDTDKEEAERWLRKAADQNDVGGQYWIGVLLEKNKKHTEALKWLIIATGNPRFLDEEFFGVTKDAREKLKDSASKSSKEQVAMARQQAQEYWKNHASFNDFLR